YSSGWLRSAASRSSSHSDGRRLAMRLLLVSLAVMAVAAWLTHYFVAEQKLAIPAGLMAALIVAATPLAVYGLQRTLGYWDLGSPYRSYHTHVDWRWIIRDIPLADIRSLDVGRDVHG